MSASSQLGLVFIVMAHANAAKVHGVVTEPHPTEFVPVRTAGMMSGNHSTVSSVEGWPLQVITTIICRWLPFFLKISLLILALCAPYLAGVPVQQNGLVPTSERQPWTWSSCGEFCKLGSRVGTLNINRLGRWRGMCGML